MLVKILPETVNRSWDLLKRVLVNCAMPLSKLDDEGLVRVFEKLLSGKVTCWYGYSDEKVNTVVLTEILDDQPSGTRNLMVIAVSIIEKVDPKDYVDMFETLRKYAEGLGCANVFCYTSNEKLGKLFDTYGANTSYKLVKFEL
jgi:hypothetical protein